MSSINTKTLITIKTEKTLKTAAQEVAGEIGISLGTLINIFLKQFVRTKEVNFSVSYKPTPYLLKAISKAEKEYAKGELPKVGSVKELVKEMRS